MKPRNNKDQQQKEILDELESIKDLLNGEFDDIPVLEELADETPLIHKQQLKREEQQHLFDPPSSPTNPSKTKQPEPKTENPFLPKHIRERLQQESPLARRSKQLEAKLNNPSSPSPASMGAVNQSTEGLIDEVIADFMPMIEAELRKRLRYKLKK